MGRTGGRGYLPSASTALPFLTTDRVSSALMRPRACCTLRICFVSTLSGGHRTVPGSVIDLARAPREIPASHRRPDDLRLDSSGADLRDIDHGNAGRGIEHQLVPLRRKRVVMEIQRRAAGIAGEADDSMPCPASIQSCRWQSRRLRQQHRARGQHDNDQRFLHGLLGYQPPTTYHPS